MGKLKNAALAQAPIQVRRQIASDPTDSIPTKVIRSKPAPQHESFTAKPSKYTYALKSYTIEQRSKA